MPILKKIIMKKHTYRLVIVIILSLSLSSCLKDELADNNQTGVYIDNTIKTAFLLGPSTGSKIINLQYSSSDTSFGLATIRVAADKPVSTEVKVVVTQNPSLIDAYNTSNGTHYATPAAGLYSIPSLTVTIPAGKTDGDLTIKLKSADIASGENAFGFTIVSVSDPAVKISGNFKNQVIILGVKNKFDGVYDLRIKTSGWGGFGIADNETADWPAQGIFMITSGANSVKLFDNNAYGTYIQPAFTTTLEQTGFGATQPKFIFDVVTNKLIDVVNDNPPGDSRNRQFMINTAVTNSRYDPDSKKIFAAYVMTQSGRPNQFIYDTLSNQSPR